MNDGFDETRLSQPRIINSEQNSFAPGKIIGGKFKVISRLGAGGMGTVYRVEQVFLNIEYALKTMENHAANAVVLQRFHLEAKAAASLDHPNLVKVHDFGTLDNGNPYLVMDYIEGQTFGEYLKKNGPIPIDKVAPLFVQACFGLMAAHEKSIVHRDIKPGNLMVLDNVELGSEGSVKLVDFGIAKLVNREDGEIQALTRTGEIFGSPLYMSPEQCSSGAVDHRSDIYSLGCVLFEMLTGTPPHMGQSALRTMMLHQTGDVPTLKEATMGKEFPEALELIVAKMLQRLPEHRYQNIGLVAHDLTMLGADNQNQTISAFNKLGLPATKNAPTVVTMTSQKLFTLIALTGLIAISIAGAAFYLFGRNFAQTQSSLSKHAVSDENVSQKVREPALLQEAERDFKERQEEGKETAAVLRDLPMVQEEQVIQDGRKQNKYVFPEVALGDLTFAPHKSDAFGKTYKRAIGTVYVPVDTPIGIKIQNEDAINLLQTPSVFAKIPGKDFHAFTFLNPTDFKLSLKLEDELPPEQLEKNVATAFQSISNWSEIESMFIKNLRLNHDALKSLNELKKFRLLIFSECHLDPEYLAKQPFLKNLEVIDMGSGDFDPHPVLTSLGSSPNLINLNVNATITKDDLEAMQKAPKLQSLLIKAKQLDDDQIEAICKLPALKLLALYNMQLSEEQIKTLSHCPRFVQISLTASRYIHPEAIKAMDPRIQFGGDGTW